MRTRDHIVNEVLVRLSVSTTNAYYTDSILREWYGQSQHWAAAYKKWPMTEGRVSTTFASLVNDEDGLLRGEYPEGWKADSIRLLTIGGKQVDKKNYYNFRKFLEDNSADDKRVFSDFGRAFYINPNIDLSGTVTVWGQYTPAYDITNENELTIFSDYEPDGNEAMVNEMLSYAHTREKDTNTALAYHQRAVQILDNIWAKIQNEQFGYQTTEGEGMYKRIDVLGGALRDDLFKRDQFY